MSYFEIDFSQMDDILSHVGKSDVMLADIISNVHQSFSNVEIKKNIIDLLPVSSANWKSKVPHAKYSQPFTEKYDNKLSITVKTISAYHYLYFPDDGSNTKNHQGNQQFMLEGAKASSDAIINKIREEFVSQF